MPLAIRAAATLLDVEIDLDAADYLNELRDERKRLKEIERVNDEDLSVTASFNLSYARLNKEQQHVFRNLSAFPASFDAAAAEAICEDEKHQSLSELLKRSLVNYSPDAKRYRLHDLVRLYAKDKSLKAGDDSYAAELRFANYYLILAIMFEKEFSGNHLPKKFAAMIDFDKESDNIFAGHHWSADVWEANPSAAQLCSLFGLFYIDLLSLRNTPRERILLLEASLNASHKIGFKPSEVILLNNIGLAYSDAGEIDLATDCYKEALNSVQKNSDRQQEGAILNNLGNQYLDDPQCALNYFSQAYEISKEFDDLRGKACSLGNLANANSLLGNTEHAINLYKESLEISEEMGDLKYIMNTYNQLGNVYKNTDEIEIAKRYYQKGLKISLQLKDREQEGTFRCNIGDIYYDENKYDQAMAFTKKGLQILNELESPHAETARNNLEFMRLISQT